jgi:hypothetical protein
MKDLKLIYCFTFLMIFSACAGNTKKDAAINEQDSHSTASAGVVADDVSKDSVSIEAKLAAAQHDTTNVTEVKFEKNSRTLPELYLNKINNALLAAEKHAPLSHVTIVVWSDEEMPADDAAALSQGSENLANDRGETIKAYVHEKHAKLSTNIVNMAKHPGKIHKFLKTDDVRIQKAMEVAGKGDPKAAHAVIIIETKP